MARSVHPNAVTLAELGLPEPAAPPSPPRAVTRTAALLIGILLLFLCLVLSLPLGTTVKIGADEDFELSKATLLLHGYRLYSDVWNDQPPLVTVLIADVLKHVSRSVLTARLLVTLSSILLISCFFLTVERANGLAVGCCAAVLLIASPGFLELSVSCMQEIMMLGPVAAALALLSRHPDKWRIREMLAGVIFGFALQMKLIALMYVPLALLAIYVTTQPRSFRDVAKVLLSAGVFAATGAIAFFALNATTGYPVRLQFEQSWAAHFAAVKSYEYGSPADRPFDWGVIVRNWDMVLPALFGVWALARAAREKLSALIPLGWLVLTFIVFPLHRPWWTYYYVHNSIPLAWCAAAGLVFAWNWAVHRAGARTQSVSGLLWLFRISLGLFSAAALFWMGARVWVQHSGIRHSAQLHSCLVLKEIERFKPYTRFLYGDEPIYSFYADIPTPPKLAVISLKRLWSGHLDNTRIVAELEQVKPGLILRRNDGREVPFQQLLATEYRRVYVDPEWQLYAHRSISRKPR